jgi:15-cis-phytoene synthase
MRADFEYCRALVRDADRDRYLASLFAPADRRDALYALYAFGIEIARVGDAVREPMPGEIRLQWWREAATGAREAEAAANPVAAALRETLARHAIATERAVALIDAHTFDLYDEPPAGLADFDRYATETQGALIATAADILDASGGSAGTLARHAGIAIAVASVLRHFGRDAARGRLYMPLDLVERHGVDRAALFAGRADAALLAALGELRGHARRHLAQAQHALNEAPPGILPALLPAALAAPMLSRTERRGYDPFRSSPISGARRQWLLWRAARRPERIFQA